MSKRRNSKTVISSADADTFAEKRPAKGMPRIAELALLSLNPASRDFKARTWRSGDRKKRGKLTLAAVTSYRSTAIFTANKSSRRDTKPVMSSAYTETLTRTQLVKKTPHRAGQASSSLSLRSRGSKARTERRGDRGQPSQIDRPQTPSVHLLYRLRVVVHHTDCWILVSSSRVVSKTSLSNLVEK